MRQPPKLYRPQPDEEIGAGLRLFAASIEAAMLWMHEAVEKIEAAQTKAYIPQWEEGLAEKWAREAAQPVPMPQVSRVDWDEIDRRVRREADQAPPPINVDRRCPYMSPNGARCLIDPAMHIHAPD